MKHASEALGSTRPQSYEELRAVLASGSVKLPKRLRDVAVFLWQHPNEVALGTSTSISEQAGVLPSTLVRFAQHLGFAGFSELQELFKSHIKEGHPQAARSTGNGADGGSGALVDGFIGAAQASLSRTSADLSIESFDRVAGILANAEIIYLVGSKRAYPIVSYMSVALGKLGIRNVLVDNVGSSAFDQIGGATARDAMLTVNFSPYNSITADIAEAGVQSGMQLVAVTDSALSPVVPICAEWIEVVESDFAGFRSTAATLTIATALMLAVGRLREKVHSGSRPQGHRRAGAGNRT